MVAFETVAHPNDLLTLIWTMIKSNSSTSIQDVLRHSSSR